MPRGDFCKNSGCIAPNDARFSLEDSFDKSEVLSKVRRVQARDFDTQQARDFGKLLLQNGDPLNVDAVKKGDVCLEELESSAQKEKNSLTRLDKLCLKFNL